MKKIIKHHQKLIAHKVSLRKKVNQIKEHVMQSIEEMLKRSDRVVSPLNLGFVMKVVNVRGKMVWFTKANGSKKWKRRSVR